MSAENQWFEPPACKCFCQQELEIASLRRSCACWKPLKATTATTTPVTEAMPRTAPMGGAGLAMSPRLIATLPQECKFFYVVIFICSAWLAPPTSVWYCTFRLLNEVTLLQSPNQETNYTSFTPCAELRYPKTASQPQLLQASTLQMQR